MQLPLVSGQIPLITQLPCSLWNGSMLNAEDGDFVDEDEDILKQMLPICKEITEQLDLYVNVNEDKTDFSHFHIARGER